MILTKPAAVARTLPRLSELAIAAALAALTVALLVATAPQIGLTWDEPVYTVAQKSYTGWLGQLREAPASALSPQGISRWWDVNHEHPPLDKLWSGLLYHAVQGSADALTAHRLGNMLLAGLLIGLLYLMVAGSYGRPAGLLAAAALISMPRFFFHAHLAALDVPAAVSFFIVISLFWHTRAASGIGRSLGIGLLLGLAWGAALATKINAAFVLPTLFLWIVLFARRWSLLLRLAVMTAVGPWVFIGLWPWLYVDTWKRLEEYIRFITVDHWKIDQWYFGAAYMPPPWHFSFVMLVMVVPLTLLALAIAGLVRGWRDPRPDSPAGLWALAALLPLLALAIGQSMVYDNERLFMASFPYLAALAGVGLDWAVRAARRALAGRPGAVVAPALLIAGAFAPQLIQSAQLYPHLLSYYSEAVGGLPGATRMGMETTYWCETYADALDYINANARQGAVVWAEDWSHDVLLTYQEHGRLREDLRIAMVEGGGSAVPGGRARSVVADIWEADYAIVTVRESGFTPASQRFRAENTPALRVERQGVTLMELYERR